jgi:hypothetical protein
MEQFIAGAMTMNILWTIIHWWFPRERKAEQSTPSLTDEAATK